MEGRFTHMVRRNRDMEVEQQQNSSMLASLKEIVAAKLEKDPYYNIDTDRLELILKDYPDKFFGIIDPKYLRHRLATSMKDLRQKLGLPETIKTSF